MKHLLLTTIAAVVLVGCSKPSPPDISIHLAAGANNGKKANIEAVKKHLADGVSVDGKNDDWTPLHIAAVEGHKEITELLIAKGARLISFEAHEIGSIWGDEPKRSISPAQE